MSATQLEEKTRSKKFQLTRGRLRGLAHFSPKNLHSLELFICDRDHTHLAIWRQVALDPRQVDLGVFLARAVPSIHRVLHLRKAILQQRFAKEGVVASRFFRVGRQVKHGENPHTAIPVDEHGGGR